MTTAMRRRLARLESAAGRARKAPGGMVVTEVVVNDPDTGKARERWTLAGGWQAARPTDEGGTP